MLVRVLCVFGLVLGMGCGGSKKKGSTPAVSTSADAGEGSNRSHECVDNDGDMFGDYCDAGDDCDDNDPTITDECTRCKQPAVDCPCDPGTKPMKCDPHYTKKVEGGTL